MFMFSRKIDTSSARLSRAHRKLKAAAVCKAYRARYLEAFFAFSGAKKGHHIGSPESGQVGRCKIERIVWLEEPAFPAEETDSINTESNRAVGLSVLMTAQQRGLGYKV